MMFVLRSGSELCERVPNCIKKVWLRSCDERGFPVERSYELDVRLIYAADIDFPTYCRSIDFFTDLIILPKSLSFLRFSR